MKKFSILALCATVAITPAFAETNLNYNTPSVDVQPVILLDVPQQSTLPTTAQADLSFTFDDTENLKAVAMTDKEMMETDGAWVPYAIGGAIGGISYVSGCAYTKCTAAGLGKSVIGGALVPMRGAQAIYGAPKVAFAGGTINGIGNHKGWW